MKYALLLFILASSANIGAQHSHLLLEKEAITDLTIFPFYNNLIEEEQGKTQWKSKFQYLDSIAIFKITYLSEGLKVKGYLVTPKELGNYPCIIYNRGGNREFGALSEAAAVLLFGPLASKGYVVIASQYRGNDGGEGQEEFGGQEVNDITILPEVLREVEGADTHKIGMYGWSRGGMMTYIALTKTDKIKAAVVGGAVSDSFETIEDRPDMETYVFSELIPNYHADKEAALTQRSAIKWVDKFPKNVPILMMHGTSDWRVKPEQSLRMAMEFEKYRIPYRLVMYEGDDHGISNHREEVNAQVLQWFDRFLKNGEAVPDMEYHGK